MQNILLTAIFLSPLLAIAAPQYEVNAQTCHGFPRVPSLQTPDGVCVGLVANQKTVGWKVPRKITFIGNDAYVTAMGGWEKNKGQIWKLNFSTATPIITAIHKGTDRTHGLRVGQDGKIYFGDATAIYRFDPKTPDRVEAVIQYLPDSYTNANGQHIESNHPLSEFIFLPDGSLVVNVGAPTNDCNEEYKATKLCSQRDVQAELRLYIYDSSTDTFDSQFVRLARGLRNSMGLVHNTNLNEIYQAENAADKPGTPDELNLLPMNEFDISNPFDFGWPYCAGMGEQYGSYKAGKFCGGIALRPLFLLPAHAAPLDMMYVTGTMFPELSHKILISYHGHRQTGSRLALFNTDPNLRPTEFDSYLVDGWQEDPGGRHPKGSPVGVAQDPSGALFVVDDKNAALLVVSRTAEKPETGGDVVSSLVTVELLPKLFSKEALNEWSSLFDSAFVRTECQSCHSDVVIDSSPEKSLVNMLNSRWISFSPLEQQTLWQRLNGKEGVRIMPPPPAVSLPAQAELTGDTTLARLGEWLALLSQSSSVQ